MLLNYAHWRECVPQPRASGRAKANPDGAGYSIIRLLLIIILIMMIINLYYYYYY